MIELIIFALKINEHACPYSPTVYSWSGIMALTGNGYHSLVEKSLALSLKSL
jgi:hypothetical protein